MTRSIRFQTLNDTQLPIEVDGVLPETTIGLELADIKRIPIHIGNHKPELGELFEIEIVPDSTHAENDRHIWFGALENVHYIGRNLSCGIVNVTGNVGRHTGSHMSGGKLIVSGNTDDFLGAEASGGLIVVHGNAGDWVGAAYPGTKSGMQGGAILISGCAGSGLGHAMRRGTIYVQENAGCQLGWNMRAGSIVVGGHAEYEIGVGMVRGTIVLGRAHATVALSDQLGPTFCKGGQLDVLPTRLLRRWIDINAMPIVLDTAFMESTFEIYHGDALKGGRGEVLLAV